MRNNHKVKNFLVGFTRRRTFPSIVQCKTIIQLLPAASAIGQLCGSTIKQQAAELKQHLVLAVLQESVNVGQTLIGNCG